MGWWQALVGGVLVVGGLGTYRALGPPRVPWGSAQVLRPAHVDWGATPFESGWADDHVTRRDGRIPEDLVPDRYAVVRPRWHSRTVHLSWQYGSCESPDFTVYVDEKPDRVVIDVWNDTSWSGVCDAVANLGQATVYLAAPLGERVVFKHRVEPPPDA